MMDVREEPTGPHALQCKEIWGGIQPCDQTFEMPGLRGRILARPWKSDEGGDIHFIGLCGHGLLSRFVVADVAGHGRTVADQARALRRLLADHMDNPDQSQLAKQLNGELARDNSRGQFATALVVSYLSPVHHLVVVNAGHPRPLWYRKAERQWHLLDAALPENVQGLLNLPLGVLDETGYTQFAVQLDPDDVLILYSDSLTDATGEDGQPLGEAGLLNLASRLDPSDPDALAGRLHGQVVDFQGGRDLADDVTVLALHHTGRDPEFMYDDDGNARPYDPDELDLS